MCKVFQLPCYRSSSNLDNLLNLHLFRENYIEQHDQHMAAFTDHAVVDHGHWTGKIIGLAHHSCIHGAKRIMSLKINKYIRSQFFL